MVAEVRPRTTTQARGQSVDEEGEPAGGALVKDRRRDRTYHS